MPSYAVGTCCCSAGGGCCAGLASTIHATYAYTDAATNPARVTLPLTLSALSGKWEGSVTPPTCAGTLTVKFYCVGPNPADCRCDWSWCNSGTESAQAGSTCSPLNVTFVPLGIGPCGGGSCSEGSNIVVSP